MAAGDGTLAATDDGKSTVPAANECRNSVTGLPAPLRILCRLTRGNRQPCHPEATGGWLLPAWPGKGRTAASSRLVRGHAAGDHGPETDLPFFASSEAGPDLAGRAEQILAPGPGR